MSGPVQVLVVGFEHPRFSGAVLEELGHLREAGVVRLIDVLLVHRHDDGGFETLPPPEGFPADLGDLAVDLLAAEEGEVAGDDETWSLADAVPAGSVAAVALLEHRWAEPLVGAIRGSGGRTLAEAWLAAEDLVRSTPQM